MLAVSLLDPKDLLETWGTLGMLAVVFVYSYQVWKTDPDRRPL